MEFRVVIDTNIWIRILLKGRITLPILEAFNQDKFQLVMSQNLLDELHEVWNRPRLNKYIDQNQAIRLAQQIKNRAIWIETTTIPYANASIIANNRVVFNIKGNNHRLIFIYVTILVLFLFALSGLIKNTIK